MRRVFKRSVLVVFATLLVTAAAYAGNDEKKAKKDPGAVEQVIVWIMARLGVPGG